MPDYTVYVRGLNSKMGKPLFNGKQITAASEADAIHKALRRDSNITGGRSKLRRSRLMAIELTTNIVKGNVTAVGAGERVEGLTPEQMVKVLKPKEDVDG